MRLLQFIFQKREHEEAAAGFPSISRITCTEWVLEDIKQASGFGVAEFQDDELGA